MHRVPTGARTRVVVEFDSGAAVTFPEAIVRPVPRRVLARRWLRTQGRLKESLYILGAIGGIIGTPVTILGACGVLTAEHSSPSASIENAVTTGRDAGCGVQPSVEGGDIYRVRNLTRGTDSSDSVVGGAGDTLAFGVRISDHGPCAPLQDVTVQLVFGATRRGRNVSSAIVRASNASPSSTSETATVVLPGVSTLTYVKGSAAVSTVYGEQKERLGNELVSRGVTIGEVGLNLADTRIVTFEMQVGT